MELHITGTNIEITQDVRQYMEAKLGKLPRHLNNVLECKVEISEEMTKSPQQRYLVRATVDGSGSVFHGEERGKDLFNAIDRIASVLTRQLEHYKGKHYKKGKGSPFARGKFPVEAAASATTQRKLVKTKRFPIAAMTLDESIEQMEKLGHDFFLFLDDDTFSLKLLYRRKDGNYGLIEAVVE